MHKKRLILNSYNESSPWSNSITTPIVHKIAEIEKMNAYIEHLNLFMVSDSTKIEKFSEALFSRYGSTPPRLLFFVGSMSLIFREEIQALWGDVPAIVCGADPYVYHEEFYRQRDMVSPNERTHMSELAKEYNFTYMHTPVYLEESVKLMQRMIPGMKKLVFLGDGIYPNPEYDKQLQKVRNSGIHLVYRIIHLKQYADQCLQKHFQHISPAVHHSLCRNGRRRHGRRIYV